MAINPRRLARDIIAYGILGTWSAFILLIVGWVVMASLKTTRSLFSAPFSPPAEPNFQNYSQVWVTHHFGDYFVNSVVVVTLSIVGLLVVALPAAYVLSRASFRGRRTLLGFFIMGMGIPIPLLFIPLVIVMTQLRLMDSLVGLSIVYIAVSLPFTIYVLQGFYSSLPSELEAAASMDGCSDWQTFWHVMLPLAAPGAATVALLNFVALWNEFQLSLILIHTQENRTLSLGIYSLISSMQYTGGNWPGLFAGVAIVMVPTVLIYVFVSHRMISGITMGGLK
jgi:N-acetylglucosamine transport system permease protein